MFVICSFEFYVTDDEDGQPLEGATIEIYDNNDQLIHKAVTDASGLYHWESPCNKIYGVKVHKALYLDEELTLEASDIIDENVKTHISLIPEIKKRDGKLYIDIESIYFDFDDHRITKQAAMQLDRVIAFMYKYPNTIIEGSSHTDCRGPSDYNLKLSTRRAQSTVNYILENSEINPARITAKAYGETSPVNHCIDGIKMYRRGICCKQKNRI